MKTQQITRRIVKTFPQYMMLNTRCVIDKSYDLILSGYALDRTPSGIYINKFYYPLFDYSEGCHLTYSDRLPDLENIISFADIDKSDLADLTLSIITRWKEDVDEIFTIEEFCHMLDKRYEKRNVWNSIVRMNYGTAQVLLGNYELAKQSLIQCRKHLHKNDIPTLDELEAKFNQSPEEAKAFILQQAEKMKTQLKLT